MILPIVYYGDPILRTKGKTIPKITREIVQLAKDMIETMHDANGVGLAAQQVGRALQIAVIDVRASDQPSQMLVGAQEVPVESRMPMVLINPSISSPSGEETGVEGCLSFPDITGPISRVSSIQLQATDLNDMPVRFLATGLLSRAIQHELDHLNGVLFIDRMDPAEVRLLQPAIDKLEKTTTSRSRRGK